VPVMATITVTGAALADLAAGAALFAGTEAHDVLSHVELELKAGYLTVRACDRYRALVGTIISDVSHTAGDDVTVLVSAKWFAVTAKAHKGDALVTLELLPSLASVSTPTSGQSIETFDGAFPGVKKLFDEWKEPVACDSIAFNPAFLADIAKIPAKLHAGKSAGNAPITLQLRGADKPALFTLNGGRVEWRGLLMPVPNAR
jgi:hypothetical protein